MISSYYTLTVLSLIMLGAGIMAFCGIKTRTILSLLTRNREKKRWQLLYNLVGFCLAGYLLAAYFVIANLIQWIPLLMGMVFFIGALFVLFSVDAFLHTLDRLTLTQDKLHQAKVNAEDALEHLQHTQLNRVHTAKMLSLGQLVAGVAHELNNPISFIYGNVTHVKHYVDDLMRLVTLYQQHCPVPTAEIETISEEIDLPFLQQDLSNLLQSMETGASRISGIVASLRNFARLDETDCKPASVQEGLENTVLLLRRRFKARPNLKAIEVLQHYQPIPEMMCYPAALNQVFMHLINNACDALKPLRESSPTDNAPNPRLWIQTCLLGSQRLRISIKDNGCGIAPEVIQQIFDPFFTTKPVGEGTGLGLSICYQIVVEQHQGELTCYSTLGEGTEFIIELPFKTAIASSAHPEVTQTQSMRVAVS